MANDAPDLRNALPFALQSASLRRQSAGSAEGSSKLKIVALVYDGIATFEFGIASEIFGRRHSSDRQWYDFSVCTIDPLPVRTDTGLLIDVTSGIEDLERAGTILMFGAKGRFLPTPDPLILALRRAHGRGTRLVSLGGGAFVLAAAGLLDGKRATTHWRIASELERLHPKIRLDPSALYVDDGELLTSAGEASSIDLLIHIVRRDHGLAIANDLARCLVISPHRDGAQAQFVEKPVPAHRDGRLASLLVRMRGSLARDFTIAELASEAAMSERTFLRRFREMTGMAPSRWLTLARIQAAKEMLEDPGLPITEIAYRAGFGSVETLRHHFRRELKLSPRDYRQQYARRHLVSASAMRGDPREGWGRDFVC